MIMQKPIIFNKSMKQLKNFILSFTATFLAISAFGQNQVSKDTISISIPEAQEYAQEYNRLIQASQIDVELAKKKVKETTAIGLPQLNLDANYQHQFKVPEMSFGGFYDFESLPPNEFITGSQLVDSYVELPPVKLGVMDNTVINLTLSQLIFSGEYLVGLQALKVFTELSEQTLAVNELKTREAVANSYYVVLVLDENIAILKESSKALSKTLEDISKMYEQGYMEDTDVDQIRINLSTIETLINSLQGQRIIADKLFKLQIGMEIEQPLKYTDRIQDIITESNLIYLDPPEFDLEISPTYQLLLIAERLKEMNLKREKSLFLPTLSGFYQHQKRLNEPQFNFMPDDLLGVTLKFPIAQSGQRIYRVQQAEMELDKIRMNNEQASRGLVVEFETAMNTYQIAYQNYLTNKQSMDLSVKIYQKNNIKFTEGIITSIDLTQSQEQYLTAQRNYYTSVVNFLDAKVALDRILSK